MPFVSDLYAHPDLQRPAFDALTVEVAKFCAGLPQCVHAGGKSFVITRSREPWQAHSEIVSAVRQKFAPVSDHDAL